jgi:hypothetical protein
VIIFKFKKIVFFLIILSFFQNLYADTWFSKNKIYSDTITFTNKKFQLLEGDWELVEKYSWHIIGIEGAGVTFAQIENNTIKAMITIYAIDANGKKSGLVGTILHKERINNSHDGCYDRSEYYLVKVWTKGASANCLKVRHIDLQKEMFSPDYNYEGNGYQEPYVKGSFKNFVKKRNLDIPKILISELHMFYSPLVGGGKGSLVYIDRNPELFGVSKTLIGNEANSEYHKNNLSKHPKKEKFVNEIIQKSFIYHKNFEELYKLKKHQKLDLGIKIDKKDKKKNDLLVDQLERLNKLYESGSITKKEFIAAKQKLFK